MSTRQYRIAILGNPNVGKSTLFTRLTKEIAHIANWPGTTVERREGLLRLGERELVLVDLPGVYSLTGTSAEERVARDCLLCDDWDAVLILVDSLAPERTLYLALHALEVTRRAVIALTKWDAAHAQGIHIHVDEIARSKGVPVVPISAVTGEGIDVLVRELVRVAEGGGGQPLALDYGQLNSSIEELEEEVRGLELQLRAPARWVALKLLEGDEWLEGLVERASSGEVVRRARELREAISCSLGRDPEELAVMYRFSYVDELSRRAVVRRAVAGEVGWVERALLSRLGPFLSLAIVFSLYAAIFTVNTGFPLNVLLDALWQRELAEAIERYTLSGAISSAFNVVASALRERLPAGLLQEVLVRGVLPGLALVVTFFPLILMALLALSFIEDSGVGPYAAAALHRAFQRVGLSGRSVYPVLISLGCNVPAVMASRAAPDESERRQLMVAVPFIPCQARLAVLMAFASAYFADKLLLAAAALLLAYAVALALFSIASAIVRGARGEEGSPELALELPPIHTPSLRVLWWISWDYTKHYLKRAGFVIFGLSVAVWALMGVGPAGFVEDPRESWGAQLARLLSPLTAAWGLSGVAAEAVAFASLAGLVAREAALLSIAAYTASPDPIEALTSLQLSPAQALALIVFFTTYMPCVSTLATILKESGSSKYALAALALSFTLALVSSTAVYVTASLLLPT